MKSQITLRERYLLLILAALGLSVGYYIFRFRGQEKALAVIETDLQEKNKAFNSAKTSLTKLTSGDTPRLNINDLQRELADLKQQQKLEQERFNQLEFKFLPPNQPQMLQDLLVEISALAATSGVRIRETSPYDWPAAVPTKTPPKTTVPPDEKPLTSGPFLDVHLLREVWGARFHQITMQSTFPELKTFLQGLHRLPWNVVVIQFEIKVETSPTTPSQPLVTKLILAL